MSSWSHLAEELLDRSDFGGQLNSGGDVRTRAELLVGDAQDPMTKMKAIYDYVRTKVEWNGAQGYIPERDVDEVLEAQSGSSPEIALLLVAMMRNVGLDAHPVDAGPGEERGELLVGECKWGAVTATWTRSGPAACSARRDGPTRSA